MNELKRQVPIPSLYFKLVVNVSAPAGSGLSYEAESYRPGLPSVAPPGLGGVATKGKAMQTRIRPKGTHRKPNP